MRINARTATSSRSSPYRRLYSIPQGHKSSMHRGICGAYHPRSGHCPRRVYRTRRRPPLGDRGFADAIPTWDLYLPLQMNCSSFVPPLLGVTSSLPPTHGGIPGLILRRASLAYPPLGAPQRRVRLLISARQVSPLKRRSFSLCAFAPSWLTLFLLKHQLLFLRAACPRLLVPRWGAGVPLRGAKVPRESRRDMTNYPPKAPAGGRGVFFLQGFGSYSKTCPILLPQNQNGWHTFLNTFFYIHGNHKSDTIRLYYRVLLGY